MSHSLLAAAAILATVFTAQPRSAKQLVAHRGASAYAPEHTLAAYRLAIEQGADFVEQDLAVTRDRVLVCIHDLTLERTTDVETVFPDRFSRDPGTGAKRWPVNDFTLEEIKKLDAGSWFGPKFAGARVPTFQEAIDLVRGRAGLYPELKDPAFYRERGIDPAALLRGAVRENGIEGDRGTPLIVQSFDKATLQQLAAALPAVARVYLVGPGASDRLDSPAKVRAIARWATGLGPEKTIVEGNPELVAWAHDAGLTVTPWTFRGPAGNPGPVAKEMDTYLYKYGVDALFTNNPDLFPRR